MAGGFLDKKNNLVKNTALLSFGTLITKGLAFFMVPFFSRWLSTEDYGIYDLMATYVTLLIPFIGLTTNEALFRFAQDNVDEDGYRKYTTNCLAVFLFNNLIFIIVCLILRYYFNVRLSLYFCILEVSESLIIYMRGFLRAIRRLDIYAFVSAITMVFTAIFSTVFIKGFSLKLEGIILGYACGYILGVLIIAIWSQFYRYVSVGLVSIKIVKKMVKYSYALIPNNIGWWVIDVSDRTIISLFLGSAFNGIYAIANKIPSIISAIFGVFNVSWQQSAIDALEKSDRNEYYRRVVNKLLVILMSLCCGVLSLNFLMFNYIFDHKYYCGHIYVPILVSAVIFSTLSHFYGGLQISFKQPKENGITTVIGAVLDILIHLLLIRWFGLFAAALSTLLSQLFLCSLRHIRIKRFVKIRYNKNTELMILIYLYFVCASFFIENMYFNITNIFFAVAVFSAVNHKMVLNILSDLISQINKGVK